MGGLEYEWDAYDGENDDISSYTKHPYCPDLHLKTAVRIHSRQLLVNQLMDTESVSSKVARISAQQLKENKSIFKFSNSWSIRSEWMYATFLNPLRIKKEHTKGLNKKFDKNFNLSHDFVMNGLSILFKDYPTKLKKDFLRKARSQSRPQSIQKWFHSKNFWETLRDGMKDRQIADDHTFEIADDYIEDMTFMINSEYCIVIYENTTWVLDYMQVVAITDTICSRYLALLASHLAKTSDLNILPDPNTLRQFYTWGDTIIRERGNEAYNIIKQIEAICTANYLGRFEVLDISKEFFQELLEQEDHDYEKMKLTDLYNILSNGTENPNQIFEIAGAYRHFGHPTVDETAGMEALRKVSREIIECKEEMLQAVSGSFKKTFIKEFLRINHRWPSCYIESKDEDNVNPDLVKLVEAKPNAISDYDLSIQLEDWHHIQFDQEFVFDDYPDFTLLLDDKALSPYLNNWYTVYNKELLKWIHPMEIPESRRLLTELLSREDIDCSKIREAIQSNNIPELWKIVGLHAKERELKIKARMFSMLCLEMRLYFSITQKNLADSLFKYMPHQTMSWSDAELHKVLLDLSNLTTHNLEAAKRHSTDKGRKKNQVNIVISLDFNKFNQKWRQESTEYIFQSFDQLFGTPNLYTYAHRFFQEAYFYLSSHLNPPQHIRRKSKTDPSIYPPKEEFLFESESTHYGQPGGCEGLLQKGWTIIIGSALDVNQHQTGVPGRIIGQGDNQVIVASFDIPSIYSSPNSYIQNGSVHLESQIHKYLENLRSITSGIGMDLKLEESWVSTTLMNYGKEIIVNGCYTGTMLKRLGRMYQDVNDIYPTLQNRTAAIFTSAQAACHKGFDIIIPYTLAVLETLNMLDRETTFGTTSDIRLKDLLNTYNTPMDDHLKVTALLLPRECGGLPVIPLLNMTYRTHPDPLVVSLLWLKEMMEYYPQARRILGLITTGAFHSNRADVLQLIQDPLSVNFSRPVQSSNKLKDILVDAVKKISKNKHIKTMFENCNRDTLKRIAEYLSASRPLYPRVLNEILRLSPDGSMLSFLATFTDMKTMKTMLTPKESHTVLNYLQQNDVDVFKQIIEVANEIHWDNYLREFEKSYPSLNVQDWIKAKQRCTTSLAQELRTTSWQLPIEGVTQPHPAEQSKMYVSIGERCTNPLCTGDEFILYIVDLKDIENPLQQRGPFIPYLGSGTSEKKSGAVLPFQRTERSLKAAQQLNRLLSWVVCTEEGCTLYDYIKDLISARTNAPLEFLILTSGENFGGTIQHRFNDVIVRHEIRPNMRPNISSHIYFTSDELGKYARGREDRAMLFQGLYLNSLFLISLMVTYSPEVFVGKTISFHQHMECEGCLQILEESLIKNKEIPPNTPILTNCPLIYTKIRGDLARLVPIGIEDVIGEEPNPHDPEFKVKAATAASIIILGDIRSSLSPVFHTAMKSDHSAMKLVCLTVGFFMKIGLKNLFLQLSKTWIFDNLSRIITKALFYSMTFSESCELLLKQMPEKVWNVVRPFFCKEEIQLEARKVLGMYTTSSELYLTGTGMGYAIIEHMIKIIKDWEKDNMLRGGLKQALVTVAPGVSLSRALSIWVNSVIMASSWRTFKQIKRLLGRVKQILTVHSDAEVFSIRAFVLEISTVSVDGITLSHAATTHKLRLSHCGAEPWIAPGLLIETQPIVRPLVSINPVDMSLAYTNSVKNILKTLKYPFDIPINPSNLEGTNCIVPERLEFSITKLHSRRDHIYRLNGVYSTAFSKYLFILEAENIKPVATMHIAEGSASVARMMVKLYGVKKIIYNSLITGGRENRPYKFIPAELQDLDGIELLGPNLCFLTGGDITHSETIRMFSDLLSNHLDVNVITADPEFPADKSALEGRNLLLSILCAIKPAKAGTFIIFKTFCRNPTLLLSQISLWSKTMRLPRIVVPPFSSHESTEVFLIGYKQNYTIQQLMDMDNTIATTDLLSIRTLSQIRIQPIVFLDNQIDLGLYRHLVESLDIVGFKNNYTTAVYIFLRYAVSEEQIKDDILRACALSLEFNYDIVATRFGAMGKLIHGKSLTVSEQERFKEYKKDSYDIRMHVESMVNTNVLRHMLLFDEIPVEYFIKPFRFEVNNVTLYTYNMVISDWIAMYSRSFFKILGHLQLRRGIDFLIPDFLNDPH